MKRARRTCTVILLVLAALLLTAVVLADGGYDLSWWTVGSTTLSTGGEFAMGGTVGQPEAGSLSGGVYSLTGGFWSGTGPQPFIFLPVIMR
jgi:hypothetical protein